VGFFVIGFLPSWRITDCRAGAFHDAPARDAGLQA